MGDDWGYPYCRKPPCQCLMFIDICHKWGVPLVIILFLLGFSLTKTIHFGYPHLWTAPIYYINYNHVKKKKKIVFTRFRCAGIYWVLILQIGQFILFDVTPIRSVCHIECSFFVLTFLSWNTASNTLETSNNHRQIWLMFPTTLRPCRHAIFWDGLSTGVGEHIKPSTCVMRRDMGTMRDNHGWKLMVKAGSFDEQKRYWKCRDDLDCQCSISNKGLLQIDIGQ